MSRRFDAVAIDLSGRNLVEASAGTGKTYAITTLFVRLVVEQRLDPSQIVVVTFTEAATAELHDRVRRRLVEAESVFRAVRDGEAPKRDDLVRLAERRKDRHEDDLRHLRIAIENVDEAAISTIHGFCHRMLHDNAFGTRMTFDAELVPDLDDLRDDVVYDFWHQRVATAPHSVAMLLDGLAVDPGRLRKLLDEIRRHPRADVHPAAPVVEDEELARAVASLREHVGFDLDDHLSEGYFVTRLELGKAVREPLSEAVNAILEGAEPVPPKHAERLFPERLRRAAKGETDPHPFFTAWETFVRLAWQRAMALQYEFLDVAPGALRAHKERRGVLGFEDLLEHLAAAVTGEGGRELAAAMQQRFRAVLIDEFQDTDPVQLEVFDAVYGRGDQPLFLIGDPKQAIYGFRGADVFTYLTAAEGADRTTMDTNWRSDPGVVAALNRIFGRPGAFLLEGIGYEPVHAREGAVDVFAESAFDVLFARREDEGSVVNKGSARYDAARLVAADVVRLLREGPEIPDGRGGARALNEADVAVLTRTNRQCTIVQRALADRGVRSVVMGDQSVFDSSEAKDVQHLLGAVLDPTSAYEIKRALATRILGRAVTDLAGLEEDPGEWNVWAERFRRWNDLWVNRSFVRMFRAVLADTKSVETLLGSNDGERALTNVLHLGELLHRAASEEHLGPAALVQWLRGQVGRAKGMARAEFAEIRLESDEDAVKILTVHKAKGLEYPVVYCPYLWDRSGGETKGQPLIHHGDGRSAVLDVQVDPLRPQSVLDRFERESLAEELRVAYVALTRAKHRCTVLWGGFKDAWQSASSSLFHPATTWAKDAGAPGSRTPTDEELLGDLRSLLGDVASARIRCVEWVDDAEPYQRAARKPAPLEARAIPPERVVHLWARTDSFTGLLRRAPVGVGAVDATEEAARDHDETAPPEAEVSPEAAALSGGERDGADAAGPHIVLDGFPGGRRTGNFFHSIFEDIDFATVTDAEIDAVVAERLEAFGFGRSADAGTVDGWREQAVRAIRDTLDTPLLAGTDLRLAAIPAGSRFNELEFHLPVIDRLDQRRLAEAFEDHGSQALPEDYARSVERLGFRPLEGFLRGYIDLVFEHEGRFYVVDYKTNHLGDLVSDYDRARMTEAMGHAHYFLQYHLYALAVHRYLRQWHRGYEYETTFGGVLYLFVKGMRPDGVGTGIFFEKPPLARMQALSRALGDGGTWS